MGYFKEAIWTEEDRTTVKELYKKLIALRADKTLTREQKTKAIGEVKENIKQYSQTFFAFKMPMGKDATGKERALVVQWNTERVKLETIIEMRNQMFKDIRRKRQAMREVNSQDCVYNGFEYEKVGGVFTKTNAIKNLIGTVDDDKRMDATKAPHKFHVSNFVGVEIECIIKSSSEYLKDKLIEANLHGNVQVKHDGSIQTDEDNDKAVELVVLAKEQDIQDVINRVCAVLDSRRIKARANNSCGLHVHLDMRRRDVTESYKRLYYSQNIMLGMVPENRRSGSHADRYCKSNTTPTFDIQNKKDDRYYVVNTEAYNKYKTLEVRVHSGTTNASKINNWIKMLTTIVNAKDIELKSPIKSIDKFTEVFKIDSVLKDYIVKRTDKFKDTKRVELDYVLSA